MNICKYTQMKLTLYDSTLSAAEVAQKAGIHKATLLRWLKSGLVDEPSRDRHGWRTFTIAQADKIVRFAQKQPLDVEIANYSPYIQNLFGIDWDFTDAKTNYLTHSLHPYPAKFIPQIPNALIQELSSVGDTVGDIFCGSGTTLVEALTLKRNAVGVDANPLACLISKAKTAQQTASSLNELYELIRVVKEKMPEIGLNFKSKSWRPDYNKLNFWFEAHVIEELAEILGLCRCVKDGNALLLALCAFSAIVVAVSNQDSDTRYVRRTKNILPKDTFKRFIKSLESAIQSASEFSMFVEPRFSSVVVESSLLSAPEIEPLDLMVCSPPYPNAFSYHLYHMTRMIWLEMDQPQFKKDEIGSHRKYSLTGKNRATEETFLDEFSAIMRWLSLKMKKGKYACFVVGNSTLKGKVINNADLISRAGEQAGFKEVARLDRVLQSTKKSFNPTIGKIRTENILILENCAL